MVDTKTTYRLQQFANGTFCVHRIIHTPIQKKYWWERQRFSKVETLVSKNLPTECRAEEVIKQDIAAQAQHPNKIIKTRDYNDKGDLSPRHYPM